MRDEDLLAALRRLKVQTGSLACLGCGREHNCGIHGCAILREAIAFVEKKLAEGLHRGIELMLYVLIDKRSAPMDDVQQLANELNHAAGCVADGYITWADIRQMLKEYEVEVVLE